MYVRRVYVCKRVWAKKRGTEEPAGQRGIVEEPNENPQVREVQKENRHWGTGGTAGCEERVAGLAQKG